MSKKVRICNNLLLISSFYDGTIFVIHVCLTQRSYIEQIGTEIYKACENENILTEIGNKIRVLVVVITEELQKLKWDGSKSHFEGCKRIQSLLKTFRDIPAWGCRAVRY